MNNNLYFEIYKSKFDHDVYKYYWRLCLKNFPTVGESNIIATGNQGYSSINSAYFDIHHVMATTSNTPIIDKTK